MERQSARKAENSESPRDDWRGHRNQKRNKNGHGDVGASGRRKERGRERGGKGQGCW